MVGLAVMIGASPASTIEATDAAAPPGPSAATVVHVAGWIALAVIIVIGVPLFLCMPPWADVTMYDVAARTLLRGGVLYRDVFDTNLPGGIWIHAVVRTAIGWRYDALRAFDLLIVSSVLWLLLEWVRELGVPPSTRLWVAVSVFAYYLFQPEVIHCQRDIWMLLPVLLALRLRRRRLGSFDGRSMGRVALSSATEGLLWGAAVWIKPFALVPAAATWLASVRRARHLTRREHARDTIGVIAGGLAAAALGIAWLVRTGAWPGFLDTLLQWDPEYAAYVYELRTRRKMIVASSIANMPWVLVHLAAAPAAFMLIARGTPRRDRAAEIGGPLLGALYWGWLVQAAFLQPRLHDYVVASMLLIAVPVGVAFGVATLPPRIRRAVAIVAIALVAFRHPLFRVDRLAAWPAAVTQGNTVLSRDRLTLMPLPNSNGLTNWTDLTRVAGYLQSRGVRDRDVVCFNESTHPLYTMLNVDPAIRYLQSNLLVEVFARHRDDVVAELAASSARFVVSDLSSIRAAPYTPTDAVPAPWNERYPWNLPVVFRAGRYFVHEPATPVTRFWR
jgi:hypothetical protein